MQSSLSFQTARAGRELSDGDGASLIDEERQTPHPLTAIEQLTESCLVDVATPDIGGRDLRLLRDYASGELLRRHLQRKESNDATSRGFSRDTDLLCRIVGAGNIESYIGG